MDSIQRRAGILLSARGEVQNLVCSRKGQARGTQLCCLLHLYQLQPQTAGGVSSWALGQ